MPDDKPKFYLTTPIYYVNARPHIGHAYTTIAADVVARRHRLLGEDVFFLTGTDEHGQKIQRAAAAADIPPQQYADQISAAFRALWQRMGITNDDFIRTTDPRHKSGVQKLWRDLEARGAIYLSTYTGQYSIGEEMFVEGPPGTIGPDGKPTETVTEENYFFKLSEYQEKIIDLIESNTLHIQPEAIRNEVLSFVRGGLKDLSISRTTFDWGIPVPTGDSPLTTDHSSLSSHVIYVWLDALANYMTAVGYGSEDPTDIAKFKKYWPADLHLVGKEITRFHCVYWPAFLMALRPPEVSEAEWNAQWLPKSIVAHGWLLFEESKMSKSRGNIVRTETILDAFGPLCPPVPASSLDSTGLQPGESGATSGRALAPGISVGLQPHEPATVLEGALAPGPPPTSTSAPVSPSTPASPSTSVLLKGTASPVPQTAPSDAAALAAEVTPSSTAPTKAHQDLFAADILRYYLLREIPFGQDGSFSFDALITRYNADLANGYGNLVSRTLSMIQRYFDANIPSYPALALEIAQVDNEVFSTAQSCDKLKSYLIDAPFDAAFRFEEYAFNVALGGLQQLVGSLDLFLTEQAPWRTVPGRLGDLTELRRAQILYTAAESIRIITALLYPVMPYATASIWTQLGLGSIEEAARNGELKDLKWGGLKPGTKLGTLSPIFPRADKGLAQIMTEMESPATPTAESTTNPEPALSAKSAVSPSPEEPTTPTITIDDFIKIDLRVAQIVVAERIPKADKLLRLEVDLGYERRQILSGIAEWYTPEELIGRRIAVIANLAPRKMRGLESHGMLLAASAEGDRTKPILATFSDETPLGSRIR